MKPKKPLKLRKHYWILTFSSGCPDWSRKYYETKEEAMFTAEITKDLDDVIVKPRKVVIKEA